MSCVNKNETPGLSDEPDESSTVLLVRKERIFKILIMDTPVCVQWCDVINFSV